MKFNWFFVILAILLALIFPNYIIQVSAKLLLSILFVSWMLSKLPRKQLHLEVEQVVLRSFLREHFTIRITIVNKGVIPVLNLAIRDGSGGLIVEKKNSVVCDIYGRSRSSFDYTVSSQTRGLYKLGPVVLSGSDPLGFFPWTVELKLERLVFVFPGIMAYNFIPRHGLTGGPMASIHPMHLDTTQIRSVRDYQTGDDPRYIHWKASASSGTLRVKEHAKTILVPYYIILNLRESDYAQKRRAAHLERCIEAAAAFIEEATKQRCSLGFLTNGILPEESRPYFGVKTMESEKTVFAKAKPGQVIVAKAAHDPIHLPVSPAYSVASQLLSILSVIGVRLDNLPLSEMFLHLQLHLYPRILVITPPIAPEEFTSIVSTVPRNCKLDMWFLDEHQDRQDRIDHRAAPPLSHITLKKLPEFGSELESVSHVGELDHV